MQETNSLDEKVVRLEKLNKIKELGINAYPENFLYKISSTELKEIGDKTTLRTPEEIKLGFGKKIKFAGRIMIIDHMENFHSLKFKMQMVDFK